MEQKPTSMSLSGAIIIAGAIIAIAIIWTKKPVVVNNAPADTVANQEISMRAINAQDHILGDPNAPIKIVEYTDPSCPYCIRFNKSMNQLIDEYGPSGKVAWVYRHFPLDKPGPTGDILHPNAGHESQALECAAELGGNEGFWAFEKRLYDIHPGVTIDSPKGLDQKELPNIAKYIGLDEAEFSQCLSSGKYKDKVEKDYLDGINAGVEGTPYSIIITKNGKKVPMVGIVPYSSLKSTVDTLLNN